MRGRSLNLLQVSGLDWDDVVDGMEVVARGLNILGCRKYLPSDYWILHIFRILKVSAPWMDSASLTLRKTSSLRWCPQLLLISSYSFSSKCPHYDLLWSMIWFEIWMDRYIQCEIHEYLSRKWSVDNCNLIFWFIGTSSICIFGQPFGNGI